jgi:hypothetical protein
LGHIVRTCLKKKNQKIFFAVLGMDPRILHTLGKHSTLEPHPNPKSKEELKGHKPGL